MTRINLVDPSALHTKHLVAELHELPRVFSLARKSQFKLGSKNIPTQYVLGTGHVLFFYDKLRFVANRYDLLCREMRTRRYNVNQIPEEELLADISAELINDYEPTAEAIALNSQRLRDRTKPTWK